MAISFIGASATSFPTHAVDDLLIVVAWSGSAQSTPSGWTSAHQSVIEEETLGVYYRIATATNTATPSVAHDVSQGLLVYRGADTTDPIGAVASSANRLPALTLQDASGSSWVACSGIDPGGMPSSVSGLTRRVNDSPYGAAYDTNGGVSSFTAKSVGIAGVSIEILEGGQEESTAGAIALTLNATGDVSGARSAAGALSFALSPAGAVVKTEGPATAGSVSLNLGLTGQVVRAGSTSGSVSLNLGLSAATFSEQEFNAQVPGRPLDEVLTGSHRRLVRARLSGGPQDGADLPVTRESPIEWEYDAPVRLSGTLTVAALDAWDELTAGAALHPESGTEILLAAGVVDDEGTEHWWPYGVVRPVTIAVTTAPDAIEVTCRVLDRGGIVAHARADRPESIASGTGLLAGILAALTRVAPWLPVDLPLGEDVQATTDVVLAERAGDDVWEGCRDVARSLGRLLYVDETGTVVAPLVTLPQATDPITVPLTAWQAEIDHERLVHQVAARWEEARPEDAAQDWVPEAGTVTVRDPASLSLPSTVPVVTRKYGGDESVLTSDTHARAAATAQLADFLDLAVSGGCSAVPHPDLEPGAILDDAAGRRFRVTRLDVDLAGGPVRVSLGNASRGLARRLAALLGYTGGRERTEIVTSVAPLMSRAIGDEDGVPLLVEPSDATAGVVVGDPIRVMHDGSGRRVATAVLVKKALSAKHAGESLGTVGGASLAVGGNATLRVRATNSAGTTAYSTFSGGDVTVSVPDPPAPNLSAYAQKNDTWRMYGYGVNYNVDASPASWSQAWGSQVLNAVTQLSALLNANREVTWYAD